MSDLFCFGLGYSAREIARQVAKKGWRVSGTSRSDEGVAALRAQGFHGCRFDAEIAAPALTERLGRATHLLISIAPGPDGDPALNRFADTIGSASALRWIGYFSTIGVYGDAQGGWIDETAVLQPTSARGRYRVAAESAWLTLGEQTGKPVHVFRLAGIYGPGRGPLEKLRAGKSRRIIKPGQVFNRIHVDDIAGAVLASMNRPSPGTVYNVTDDEPASPQDVIAHAAGLIGAALPPSIPIEEADLSDMARSFYADNKRVSNKRLKTDLGYTFKHPTFREGLQSLVADRI